jgi:hypothetical protein
MKYLKTFENHNDIDILDAAWLYFIHSVYRGEMEAISWEDDDRMGGRNFVESMNKFDCVELVDGYYVVTDAKKAKKIVDSWFKMGFKEAVRKIDEENPFSASNYNKYNINSIPYEYYLYCNPGVGKAIENTIHDDFVDHWNSQTVSSRIIDKQSANN